MTFLAGAFWGLLGCVLYQLICIHQFRLEKKKWPWQDRQRGNSPAFFLFSTFVKLGSAFAVVGLLAVTGQVAGPWLAVGSGMVADLIVIKLASSLRQEQA